MNYEWLNTCHFTTACVHSHVFYKGNISLFRANKGCLRIVYTCSKCYVLYIFSADDVAGKVSLKHVYEIAKIKLNDQPNKGMSLEEMCKCIIGTAHSCGIEVVKSLDPKEYAQFLEERKLRLEEFEKALEESRQAKLLRL